MAILLSSVLQPCTEKQPFGQFGQFPSVAHIKLHYYVQSSVYSLCNDVILDYRVHFKCSYSSLVDLRDH